MIYKDTIDKISSNKDWLEKERNKSQILLRLTREANKDIDDLAVLAQALPPKTWENIFTFRNIEKLINSILEIKKDDATTTISNLPTAEDTQKLFLATYFIEIGIKTCIWYYMSKLQSDPTLNKSVIDQLLLTNKICKEIYAKVRLWDVEKKEKGDLKKIESLHTEILKQYYETVDKLQSKEASLSIMGKGGILKEQEANDKELLELKKKVAELEHNYEDYRIERLKRDFENLKKMVLDRHNKNKNKDNKNKNNRRQ